MRWWLCCLTLTILYFGSPNFATHDYAAFASKKTRDQSSQSNNKPRIILHVGPHKTGSSHIQTALLKHRDKLLANYNFCFPSDDEIGIKEGKNLAQAFFSTDSSSTNSGATSSGTTTADHGQHSHHQHSKHVTSVTHITHDQDHNVVDLSSYQSLHQCLQRRPKPNLILSSEEFDRWNEDSIQRFYETMTSSGYGYDLQEIEVVIVYRDWLTHLYSMYTQLTKSKIDTTSFSDYFFSMHDLEHHVVKDIYGLIERFQHGLSKSMNITDEEALRHIHVIDYQGSFLKKVDIAYVLLCEIAHILCLELEELMTSKESSSMTFENKKPDNMLSHEIAGQFHYFVRSLGCQLCGSELKGYSNWTSMVSLSETSRVTERHGGMNTKLPSSTLNLGVLRYYAKDYDDKIRRSFGTRMYHANRDANMKVIDEFEIESIHRPTLVKNDRWIKRFIDEFSNRVKRKMICECDGPLIAKALHSNI